MTTRRRQIVLAGALLPALPITQAIADPTFPSRPLRLVVPFAPGGSNDAIARVLAPKLSEALGQPVVVDNRAGAGGAIGAVAVAKADPDGYTILTHSVTVTIQQSMILNPTYYVSRDFEPVSLMTTTPFTLVVNPKVPAKNLAQFLEYARQRGTNLFFGSAGNGSSPHLAGEYFNNVAGTKMQHVPYKGNGPMLAALLAGDIEAGFDTIVNSKPLAEAGRIRVLALTGTTRNASMPEVPAMMEGGLPGFNVTIWQAMFLPKGTPPPIVTRWHAAIVKVLTMPEIVKRMEELGFDVVASTPAKLKQTVESEIVRWAEVVKKAGIKPE